MTMTSERSASPTTTSRKYTALKAFSCCALLGVGVFCNLPHDLQGAKAQTSSLRGGTSSPETSFTLPTNETTDYAGFQQNSMTVVDEKEEDDVKLDFFVSGFPKCGTTTLLKTFEQHVETVVPPLEECSLDQVVDNDAAYARLMGHLNNATNSTTNDVKRGIKCPSGLTTPKGIERLEEWFPNARLIFGLRHPVLNFQSYYNYRVLEVHQGRYEGKNAVIPPPQYFMEPDAKPWLAISLERMQYEVVLEKLGKTKASQEPRTPFKVFLYHLEQMTDQDEDRRAQLRATLGNFLELKTPIEPLKQANRNPRVGKRGFDETIDICDSKHDALRAVLVENGKKTQRWMLEEFLESPDVTVANRAHFREIVSQWGTDPCDKNEKKEDSQAEAQ